MSARFAATTVTDEMQIEFARLVTSPAARTRFANAPSEEAPALADLSSQSVTYYANALLAKRLHEIRRLLPSIGRRGDLRARFAAHAMGFAPGGHGRHREDAIAFARTLGDDARLDRLALEATRGDRFGALAIAHGHLSWWFRPWKHARLWSGRVAVPRWRTGESEQLR